MAGTSGYLLQARLDSGGKAHPEKAALSDTRSALSYRALREGSDRVAGLLKASGVRRKDRVAILQERSVFVVLSMLGILKADAVYVPVDVKAPAARREKILGDCRPAAILCDGARKREIEASGPAGGAPGGIALLDVESALAEPGPPAPAPECRNIDTDAACILYTSGSTGSPKGVLVSHRNILSYIDWAVDCFGIGSDDRILSTAPFHFDMSTFDIYASLSAGATLCIAPEPYLLFPTRLLDLMERERVTIWKGVSSLLAYLSTTGALKADRIPTLRHVLFGGEVLPTKHLIRWMETFPGKKFCNAYGPTEATGISAYYPVEAVPADAGEPVPIGKPCANKEILLLAEDGRLAEAGEAGELCIRGSCLSAGYWDDPEKTAGSFVPNPFGTTAADRIYRTGDLGRMRPDGNIEYLGRKDFQVKFMGYRIELHEIERALLSLGKIDQAVVLLCEDGRRGVQQLVGFVEGPEAAGEAELLKGLEKLLPPYMVPRQLVRLGKIPRNDRGKTDRDALRALYSGLARAHA